jgi:hypothetical protein
LHYLENITPLMPATLRIRLCLIIALLASAPAAFAQSILLDHRTATYGNPLHNLPPQGPSATTLNTRTLVTTKALPAEGDFEVLGQIDVYSRWFGHASKARKLLAEKAKGLGANAVFESQVWLAPAFPATVAPHGRGIAVRINDYQLLEKLADSAGSWE